MDDAYRQTLQFLYGRVNHERSPVRGSLDQVLDLAQMRRLMELLDWPDAGLPVVHVAGTKGKGSTAAMIAAVLGAAGKRVGLYTSPHLESLEERVRVDERPIPAADLVRLVERLKPIVAILDAEIDQEGLGRRKATFFELFNALAWMYFQEQQVDAVVLEVGLGGRLDSTNVCRPTVTVITTISFDHTQQLGKTLEKIAREKAGILKPVAPLVCGVLPDEPRTAIHEEAARKGVAIRQLGVDFSFEYHAGPPDGRPTVDFVVDGERCENVELGLLGRHQGLNAAVAAATIGELRKLGWDVPEAALRAGLRNVDWPARVELVRRRPWVVLDVAHNAASAAALVSAIREAFPGDSAALPARRTLVFAASSDKDLRGMLAELLPFFSRIILTTYTTNPRATPTAALYELAVELGRPDAELCDDPQEAWDRVRGGLRPDDLVCVAGSIFLAAELRRRLLTDVAG